MPSDGIAPASFAYKLFVTFLVGCLFFLLFEPLLRRSAALDSIELLLNDSSDGETIRNDYK